MNTYINSILDQRRIRNDGKFPIIFRLTHNRKTTSISTGFYVSENHWDKKRKEVKPNYNEVESVPLLNTIILKERARLSDIINKLYDKGELQYLSIQQIKQQLNITANFKSFIQYGEHLVEELNSVRRFGTARSYKCTLKIMMTFAKKKDIKFNEVNYGFLMKFEKFHLKKEGNNLNGLAAYLRTIRAIYNKGIKDGCIEKEAYPFAKYKIKTTPTRKRALDISYIQKLLLLDLSTDHELFHARNYFLISFMLYGMTFMDMAFLKIEDIKNGRVIYQRKKTSKNYNIKIPDKLNNILKFYTEGKTQGDFIFPIILREKPEQQYQDVIRLRTMYNDKLKSIAKLCGIEQSLTSYVSRHSFATNAMLQNIPIQAISSMLGHSKLNTTQIYLKSLPNEMLDDYNEDLCLSL